MQVFSREPSSFYPGLGPAGTQAELKLVNTNIINTTNNQYEKKKLTSDGYSLFKSLE